MKSVSLLSLLSVVWIICFCFNVAFSLCCPTYTYAEVLKFGGANAQTRLKSYRNNHRRPISGTNYVFCMNGRPLKQGFYCATGSCNIFGCDCLGHCFNDDDE